MDALGFFVQLIIVSVAGFAAFIYSSKGGFVIRKLTELSYGKPGCAPVSDVGNVTLHYFAVRGRAEAIRLLMEEAQLTYSEVLFTPEFWPDHKKKGLKSGLLTFGQVPAIETTSGVRMVQSQAIIHYLGRATGMECDCEDLHHCEVIALGVEDIRKQFGTLVYNKDFSLKDRDHYLAVVLPMWLGYLEKLAPALSKQELAFFASDRLTWVDFLVYDLLEVNIEFARYEFSLPATKDENLLEKYPKLNNFFIYLSGHPNIARYRESKHREPFRLPRHPVEAMNVKP